MSQDKYFLAKEELFTNQFQIFWSDAFPRNNNLLLHFVSLRRPKLNEFCLQEFFVFNLF